MSSVREKVSRKGPACLCCGSVMDLYSYPFSTKVNVGGIDYYCNNPSCCCDYRPR